MILTVSDDGTGVPEEVLGGRGLANMTERARSLADAFDILPQTTGGSLLTWQVPARLSIDLTAELHEGTFGLTVSPPVA